MSREFGKPLTDRQVAAALDRFSQNMRLAVVMQTHEDYLINVLLNDGRFYTFCTEMWPEHGCAINANGDGPTNWPRAIRRAELEALDLGRRGASTWGLDAIPETEEQFIKAIDFVCGHASDETFRRFVR